MNFFLILNEEDENGHDQTNKPYGAVKHAYDENNKLNINNTSNNQDTNNTESMDEDSSSNDKTFLPTENLKIPIGMLTVIEICFVFKKLFFCRMILFLYLFFSLKQ